MSAEVPPWREFAAAPLTPIALSATFGLLFDRGFQIPLLMSLIASALSFVVWFVLRQQSKSRFALWFAFAGLASGYHHAARSDEAPDSLSKLAFADGSILKLRGVLLEEPFTRPIAKDDPLQPQRRNPFDRTRLAVSEVETDTGWRTVSGTVRLRVEHPVEAAGEPMAGLHCGDRVQAVGRYRVTATPSNPGEVDQREADKDKGIRGDLRCGDTSSAVVRLEPAGFSVNGLLATVRGRASRILRESLGEAQAPIGQALLLGDGNALSRREWDVFIRTGSIHVLAISGQHLVLLGGFVALVLLLCGFSRRRAAWIVAGVVFGYALLTGLRPSALRAAVMVASVCGSAILRRPPNTANSFALAWLAVLAVNPTDAFDLGCRLSFLSVFVLIWYAGKLLKPKPPTPLERLIDETRPTWLRWLRGIGKGIALAYLVNLILFIANTPLLIAEQNLASPVGILVGPILVLLTSVALVSGFLLLLLAPIPLVGDLLAFITRMSLLAADSTATTADGLLGGCLYLPSLPFWWLIGFYAIAAILILGEGRIRKLSGWALPIWVLIALLNPGPTRPSDELRMTFLAVGHGTCIVLETPDGRCLLYDVGSTGGPDAVRRVIAPYLWHRGIRRVEEVFISHADSDHYNGLVQLARRFPIGRVTFTPSFAQKPAAEVEETLKVLNEKRIPIRTICVGESFSAGDVQFEVLHPFASGPPGTENERSLVLLVNHAAHRILLTGDLEKAGTDAVLKSSILPVNAMQAPHHGSKAAFSDALKLWAKPNWIFVTRGDLYSNFITSKESGVPVWDTQSCGAISLRSHASGLTAEAFRTGELVVLPGR